MGAQTFRARIERVGILRCVTVPQEVGASFGEWSHPPVRFRIGRHEGGTHVSPGGGGTFRLFLDAEVRKKLGVDTGNEVEVIIELDPSIDDQVYPDELLALADSLPGGVAVLETLPPGLKRQLLKFFGEARSAPARAKRLQRIEELLRERIAKQGGPDEE